MGPTTSHFPRKSLHGGKRTEIGVPGRRVRRRRSRPYDPCYHRACDTIDNVNREVLEQNTRALLRALDALVSEIP